MLSDAVYKNKIVLWIVKWKMLGIKRELVSAKQKVFKVFRLIPGIGKEGSNISSPTLIFSVVSYEPVNSHTNYSLQAELKKAKALMYCRMWDRGT